MPASSLQSRLTVLFPACCATWLVVRAAGVFGRMLDWKPAGLVVAEPLLSAVVVTVGSFLALASLRTRPASPARSAWALGATISVTFLLFDLGKFLHPDEMVAFFRASGWPAWLHWAVMIAEVVSALTIARYAPGWAGAAAAMVLLAIMGGAVFTHLRNGDPLVAIGDAARQAVLLTSYLALHPGVRRWRRDD